MVLVPSIAESADDITAAATAASPITPTQFGVRYLRTRGRIREGSGEGRV